MERDLITPAPGRRRSPRRFDAAARGAREAIEPGRGSIGALDEERRARRRGASWVHRLSGARRRQRDQLGQLRPQLRRHRAASAARQLLR
jgi:hypothetical protein